ncbi:pyridoxamine 5'-phosphate oxidase family protein [Geotalea sp. SG265]|uniref:pyridoxamine 5'-phosphate oxidase family protein n=1 Tax=Geotalea sp. SG265 TaxID=2922867 RepID=UPI001FAEE132|nr:pyridoxamine 5'-phosphate oxidase family protein [Geotalea sp. SG265]
MDALGMKVARYLEDHHVATLATFGSEGPLGAAVFYASDGYTLYFLSSPTSRHALELAVDPRVAVTIQENQTDWLKIKGVQMEGEARELAGAEEEHARRLYGNKFPLVGMLDHAPAAIVKALAKVRWYRITPRRLYFIDNSLGLGHREEVDVTSAGKDTNRHGA